MVSILRIRFFKGNLPIELVINLGEIRCDDIDFDKIFFVDKPL